MSNPLLSALISSVATLRALAAPHSSDVQLRAGLASESLPTRWTGVLSSSPQDQYIYTSVYASFELPKLAKDGNQTSASIWIGMDAQNCNHALLAGIDMTLQPDGDMVYAAWGFWYDEGYSDQYSFKTPLTDEQQQQLDLRIGDHIELNITHYNHYVTITNPRTGMPAQTPFESGGRDLCQRNVVWAVGRTDDASPAVFSGGNFTFRNAAALTLNEGSVGLQGATSAGPLDSPKCYPDAADDAVVCTNS